MKFVKPPQSEPFLSDDAIALLIVLALIAIPAAIYLWGRLSGGSPRSKPVTSVSVPARWAERSQTGPCRWKKGKVTAGGKVTSWQCSRCGEEGYSFNGKPPVVCKGTLGSSTL